MSTNSICFSGQTRKLSTIFVEKEAIWSYEMITIFPLYIDR